MQSNIKLLCLICLSTILFSCATFNISAKDNNVTIDSNNSPAKFETVVKNTQDSIVLLTTKCSGHNSICISAIKSLNRNVSIL